MIGKEAKRFANSVKIFAKSSKSPRQKLPHYSFMFDLPSPQLPPAFNYPSPAHTHPPQMLCPQQAKILAAILFTSFHFF